MPRPTAAYICLLPFTEAGHTRTFEAEIDNLVDSETRVQGTLTDARCALAAEWVARLPAYEIRHASATHRSALAAVLSPALPARLAAIRGTTIGQGFTRTRGAALGGLLGSHRAPDPGNGDGARQPPVLPHSQRRS